MDWDEEELSTQIYDKPEGNVIADVPAATSAAPAPAPPPRPSLGLGNIAAVAPPAAPMAPPPMSMSSPGMPSPLASPSTPGMPSPIAPMGQPMGGAPSPFDAPLPGTREPTAVTRHREEEPKRSMLPILAVAAVVLLAVVGVGGYMMFGRSQPGTIHLTTDPNDAVVYLDTQPITTATSSPFTIPNVAPGSHLVEVRKRGFEAWSTRVDLASGQELTLPPVTLAPEGGAVAAGTPRGTGFTLDSVPSGARVFVNDRELPQHTPVQVTDLAAGTYQVRVESGASYAPWASQITVGANQVVALPAAVLTLRAVTVQFTSTPDGASVTLVRGAERRSVGTTPISADVDITGGAWTVEMEHAGYRDYSAPLTVPAGQSSATHAATLEESARVAVASTGPRTSPPSTPPSTGGSALSSRIGPRTTPPPSTAAPSGGGGNGTLRINTRPWSQVFVDGRLIGNTPQMNISLPAGRHTVTLVNSEFNIRETVTIEIQAGQTETRVITLTPGGG
jgi:hypothetical protein